MMSTDSERPKGTKKKPPRPPIKPSLLRWARERAGLTAESLTKRFPKYELWERGEVLPTLKQLEKFANAVHVSVGYLFLPEPPIEELPIPDFRTVENDFLDHPSPDLLDTIYICQERQVWYREYCVANRESPLAFVGSVRTGDPVERVAEEMRRTLGFDLEERRVSRTWTDALRRFMESSEELGVLVMCNGVVLSNNFRRLDPREFRGFALADDLAPLVFINGADTKAGQMFTLAHELVHIWIGESALTDAGPSSTPTIEMERWCNEVAAELLVPLRVLQDELPPNDPLADLQRLARRFKVSTLVILRRILDAGQITRKEFSLAYEEELAFLMKVIRLKGGDFYRTHGVRTSPRFTRALVSSTLEGQTLYRDACRMLGISNESTFHKLSQRFGLVS